MLHDRPVTAGQDLPARRPQRRQSAGTQVAGSIAVGIVLAIPLAALTRWNLIAIFAWDLAALTYLLWVWLTVWQMSAEKTAEVAVHEDPTRATSDLVTIVAAVVSLVAVGFVLSDASTEHGTSKVLLGTLGVASVAISWTMVHTTFALLYARLYYTGEDGGIDFPGAPPRYSDFAYLAFTLGMTFQVSDTGLQDNVFRRAVLRHTLLSYVFGTGILATTINLVANL